VGDVSPSRGLEIYQGALRHVLADTLTEIFPVCVALVGAPCFGAIARAYAEAIGSRHPDLGRLGDALPDLLPSLEFLETVPYLADVARLELALHRAADAADPPPVDDPARLGAALAGAPDRWRFRLPPSATLLESVHPVRAIWEAHQHGPDAVVSWPSAAASESERLLVWRSKVGLAVESIEDESWALLCAIAAGASAADVLGLVSPDDVEPTSAWRRVDPDDHAALLA